MVARSTTTSPSRNERGAPPRVVVVGNPEGRRTALLQEALARLDAPAAAVVSYAGLIDGRESLADVLADGAILRIDSPDRDFEAERALIALGADVEDEVGPERIDR